jgi:hypothetical protein
MKSVKIQELKAEIEVLIAVIMKSAIPWDVTPYSLVESDKRFGENYYFHLQGL